jgi:beta-galactosidase
MSAKAKASAPRPSRVRLTRGAIVVGERVVPLLAGSVHYWRLDPADWRAALQALRDLGLGLLDTYIPWGVHERSPGEFDFGEQDPRLDFVAFLKLSHELGLYAIVRPGPHVNAELTHFGLPERIIWDADCQARSARGKPVVLPVPPLAFPVPSYVSRTFLSEARRWLLAAGTRAAPLCYPDGPIVLCQVDNEGAMYFRDGVYDQDYHPDAVAAYQRFLEEKYQDLTELGRALGHEAVSFAVDPPRGLDVQTARELTRHLDWAEAQEVLLAAAMQSMRDVLLVSGLDVPMSHNLPIGEALTPLDPARLERAVDFIGLDYYHAATPAQRSEIARRTSELSVRSAARDYPAFACELGAGFPPFFPPLSEDDNLFTALSALAYGLRGFNLYMAVERDRWIGAPYDRRGRRRSFAERWSRLSDALERVSFHTLVRDTPVHLVVPRSLRRLQRVLHAFGPLSAVAFQIAGRGAADGGLEDPLDLGTPFAIDAELFLRRFEEELERQRIPFAVVGGDLVEYSLEHARWTVIACSGGLERGIVEAASRGLVDGRAVAFGPHFPERDEALIPREPPSELRQPSPGELPSFVELEPSRIAEAVGRAREVLGLPAFSAEPAELAVTLHRDGSGRPRVMFAINAHPHALEARVESVGASRAEDLLDGSIVSAVSASFSFTVPERSVRMFALS